MSRMDKFETATPVDEDGVDEDVALWNRMGRAAMFFCIWVSMAIPVLLIISVR